MKRILSMFLVIALMLCLFTGCDSDSSDIGNDTLPVSGPGFNVTVEIECVENWIFNKYDVDVYIGEDLQGTITHGDTKIFELTLAKGTYTMKFVSDEDSDLTGVATLHIHQNESLKYKISCHSSGIDVETVIGTMPPKDETGDDTSARYTLDYADAESFEAALNNGAKVNGKVVQFVVNDYKPDSILGINCWAGEHLNFISENELNVAAGDVIVGYVSEEPSTTLGGSWKIPFIALVINEATTDATVPPKPEDTTPEDTTHPATEEPTMTETTSTAVIGSHVLTPISHKGTVGLSGEDVVALFTEAGFTNITMEELKLDYDPEVDYKSGYCKSVAINGEYFFEENVPFDADVPIVVLYVTYPENVSPTIQPTETLETEPPADEEEEYVEMVWIPQSGSKYHSRKGCSGMENPTQVTKEEAIAMGYTACKRCH